MRGRSTIDEVRGATHARSGASESERQRSRHAASLPYFSARAVADREAPVIASADVEVPAEYVTWVTERHGAARAADGIAAAFAVYVARVTGDTSFDLGVELTDAETADGERSSRAARQVACRVQLDMERGFDETLGRVTLQLARSRESARRHVPRRDDRRAAAGPTSDLGLLEAELPLAVALTRSGDDVSLPPGTRLCLAVAADGRGCRLVFDRSGLAEDDARRIAGHLTTLLRAVTTGRGRRPLRALPLLTPAERERMLVEWNDTATDYARSATVHSLFEEQAARTPNAIAVEQRGRRVTYRELDDAASRWATHLRAVGVGADTLVGLRAERSIELVVGLLAVLKAGGAYLPIDPAYPPERTAFMLEDSGARIVLTTRALRASLPRDDVRALCLDEPLPPAPPASADAISELPARPATAESLAYVLYTSGSTGTPKGVLVHHRGVVNYLAWCVDAYELREGGGCPVHSPVSFDLTVTSLLAPLVAGRTAVLVDEEEGVDGLAATLRARGGFSLVKITPSHLDALRMQLGRDEAAGRTRMFVVGGEALKGESLAFWQRHAPDTVIVNEYGPTETVVGCCVQRVTAADEVAGPVPIGRPIANTRLYVLDANMQPLPAGVPGELFIGGDGVARGYLNRPSLTAAKFVDDPFAAEPGARLYRTGDRARYRADGTLEFLGRFDDQVKVRGYRIELGEVEAALASHGDVAEAAVAVRESEAGDPRLVGYYVAESASPAPSEDALRAWLRARLPEYMVPAAIVRMDELPLTSNGKVDRKALPEPPAPPTARERVAPRTEVEHLLTRIWREVLGVDAGVTDDFFELGGHSLLAVRMMQRVAETTGARPPLAVLHTGPTIRELAAVITRGAAAVSVDAPVVKLRDGAPGRPGFFFFHGAIGGSGFYAQDVLRQLDEGQPAYIVHPFDIDGPSSVEEMAAARVAAIRAAQPSGPYHLGGVCNGGSVAYEVARQLRALGERVGVVALINTGERNAGLRPLRVLVSAAARIARLDRNGEVDVYLRVRDRLLWHLPLLPHVDHRSTWRDRVRFAGAAARFATAKLLGKATGRGGVPGRLEEAHVGSGRGQERDARMRRLDAFYDRVLQSYVPGPYDGPVAVLFWEASDAADDEDGLHRDDWTRGWGRLTPRTDVLFVPGDNRDVNTRDAAALGRELAALLRQVDQSEA